MTRLTQPSSARTNQNLQRHAEPSLPNRAITHHAMPDPAIPHLTSPAKPNLTAPNQNPSDIAAPHQACHTTPPPCRAMTYLACQTPHRLAVPRRNGPDHACRAGTYRATLLQTQPYATMPAMNQLTTPSLTRPRHALPHPDLPNRAVPCLPNRTKTHLALTFHDTTCLPRVSSGISL